MRFLLRVRLGWAALVVAVVCPVVRANERVTLKNGFEMECSRREVVGDRVRLYLVSGVSGGPVAGEGNYVEVAADDVARVETVPDAVPQGLKPLSIAGSYGTHSTSLRAGSKAVPLSKMVSSAKA